MTRAERACLALERVRRADHELLADLTRPLDPKAPTALDGWTVGHLLTHLARNADSVTRRLMASAEGRHIEQHEGGAATREREIAEGAARPYDVLVADVANSARLVEGDGRLAPRTGLERSRRPGEQSSPRRRHRP